MQSSVAIFDIETGAVDPVLTTDRHVEAPNWTPDGAALVINGAGKLYRVPLDHPEMQEIDTGFAIRINNDHGISPNGEELVISDSTEIGESCIYILPAVGGTPVKVTEEVPSYWHGWSPDGTTLAYTAKRGDTFQIYTCPATGGAETQLTDDFDHCDGPDYTPDGDWIWFNGEKLGAVQLWRVRPDGSDLQQMTDDERVNWFPHPSPDGNHVLYLAYESGTHGHPANQNVQLRLIDRSGGETRTLHHMFGGQGTINVPCWAPDSTRFAFVHFSR